MQLNLSFPPSFPSNVAWHPPLIRKARTRCDLCRALHDFARLRLTSQCLPAGNYGWRVWTQRGWLPINLLIYERRPWNAHGQHSWTPWHHWLQHQVTVRNATSSRHGWPTMWTDAPTANLKRSSGTDLRSAHAPYGASPGTLWNEDVQASPESVTVRLQASSE